MFQICMSLILCFLKGDCPGAFMGNRKKPRNQLVNTCTCRTVSSLRFSTYKTGRWRCSSNISYSSKSTLPKMMENWNEACSISYTHTYTLSLSLSKDTKWECCILGVSSVHGALLSWHFWPVCHSSQPLHSFIHSARLHSFIHVFIRPTNVYIASTLCQVPGIQRWTIYHPCRQGISSWSYKLSSSTSLSLKNVYLDMRLPSQMQKLLTNVSIKTWKTRAFHAS